MDSVLVTGASTGIGLATVKVLTEHGLHVFASVRKQSDADQLTTTFGDRVTPLFFDVTDERAVTAAVSQVSEALAGATLKGLVNNAGIATGGPLAHIPIDEFRYQLEINLVGVLIVTQAFLPLLGMDRKRSGTPGRVVNISSVGGRIGAPFMGSYTTSKHGLEGFSETLRRELMLYGIDVIIVAPGAIATPIWDKAAEIDDSQYEGTDYQAARKFRDQMVADGRKGLPPEAVGDVIYDALTADHPKTRYTVVRDSVVNWTLPRLLPTRLVDQILAESLGWDVVAPNKVMGAIAKRLGSAGE